VRIESRKFELECLRLAADCMQLVSETRNPDLQRHFLRMAKKWTVCAEQGRDANIKDAAPMDVVSPVRVQASLH
jgi:hypothetical protein